MAAFRETRNAVLLVHSRDIIPEEEFVLLHDLHTSKNLDYPYWSYNEFDLENSTDTEWRSELHVLKGDVYRFFEVFEIPEQITYYSRSKFSKLVRYFVYI